MTISWYVGTAVAAVCALVILRGAIMGVARGLYEGIRDRRRGRQAR